MRSSILRHFINSYRVRQASIVQCDFPSASNKVSQNIWKLQGRGMATDSTAQKWTCLVTRPDLPECIFTILKDANIELDVWNRPQGMPRDEMMKRVHGKDAIACTLADKIDGPLLDAAGPSLKIVSTISVGYDHVDVPEVLKRGVKLGNTPGVLTDTVAELTIALLLATTRRLLEANQALVNGKWPPGWNHLFMCGTSIKGRVIGFLGMGRIAYGVLERLKPFRAAEYVYTARTPHQEADQLGAKFASMDEMLAKSDVVIVLCALNKETRHIMNAEKFAKMKKGAIIINTARGPIIDQKALYDSLTSGHLGAAGLDVMEVEPIPVDDPLIKLPNVVLLPHIGSASIETREAMARLAAENIVAAMKGEKMPAEVTQ